MSISSYNDLVAAVQNWLFGRADIVPRVPEFIALAEAKLNRTLKCRQMEARSSATVDPNAAEPEFITLPGNFHSMRRVRLSSAVGKPRLKFATGAQIDDMRAACANHPGQPAFFTIFGDELELFPTPDGAYTIEMVSRSYIPALNSVVSGSPLASNWLLALAPDAYLYGALMEAAPYLHEDERIATWATGLSMAVQQLNDLSEEATYNAGPLVVRRGKRGY